MCVSVLNRLLSCYSIVGTNRISCFHFHKNFTDVVKLKDDILMVDNVRFILFLGIRMKRSHIKRLALLFCFFFYWKSQEIYLCS